MIIKILKGEYIFSEMGTHICDASGFALKATDALECEITDEHFDRVRSLVTEDRLSRGLDADGKRIPEPQPDVSEPQPDVSEPQSEVSFAR